MADPPEKELAPEIVAKLENAFCHGMTITMACLYAGIHRATFYRHYPDGHAMRDRFTELCETPKLQAQVHLIDAVKKGDLDTVKWFLERAWKDRYSTRIENTGRDGEPPPPAQTVVLTTEEAAREYAETMKHVKPKRDE